MTHPLILLPKYIDLEMGLRPTQFAGFYRIRKGKRGFGHISDTGWFPNVITNAGLNRIGTVGSGGSWGTTAVVGTGSATPDVTDTALQALLATTITQQEVSSGNITTSPRYGYQRITRRFAEGVAAGNLTEVGYGWTSSNLFSRALILDGMGAPGTITVQPDEYLDVSYELRHYVNESDYMGTWSITGSGLHDYVERALGATDAGWQPPAVSGGWTNITSANSVPVSASGLVALTDSNILGAKGATSFVNTAYTGGTLYRDRSATYGLNDGNVGGAGIKTFGIRLSLGGRQIEVTPAVAKTSSRTFNYSWRTPWARKVL